MIGRALLAVVVTAFLAAPAHAAETSPGVRLHASIAERGVVSARAVGSLLYVSSLSGVTIFDISDPRAPARVGRLELPNAQNEDVDVGSGIMLVSDDPFGGRGLLHVVDVGDPARPRVLSTYASWRRGGGHTATCIQACRYAWLAGSPDGIEIVDLRDPARPRHAGRFLARAAGAGFGTHDVQVDGSGLAWVAGSSGTAAYDVTDPVRPRLVKRTDRRGAQGPLNDFIHHNSLRLPGGVLAVTEEDFGDGCRRAGTLQTWRVGRGRLLRPLDTFGVEFDRSAQVICSAHYFDARDGLIAQGFYEQGVRLVDARDPRRLRQVGYYVARPGLFWGALFAPTDPTGSTVYAIDHSRGIDVLALDRGALRPVRRRGSRATGPARPGFALGVFDGLERARPGRRVEIALFVSGSGGPARVRVALPRELVGVRPGPRVRFDPATRTVRFTVRRVRGAALRIVRARIARSAPPGAVLETIGSVRGPRDPLPLDDRGVDRTVVAGGRGAAAAAWQGFCALPSDYTL